MSGEKYDRVKKIFLQATGLDAIARSSCSTAVSPIDPDLRAQVESLLAHHWSQTILDSRAVAAMPRPSGSALTTIRRASELMLEEIRAGKGTYLAATLALALSFVDCKGFRWQNIPPGV